MIKTQKVNVVLNPANIKEYNKLFDYELKVKDTIILEPNLLMRGSHALIVVCCDICGKEKQMEYRIYYKITKNQTEKYYCRPCSKEKIIKTNLERYGVEHSTQNLEIKNKIIKTNLKRYGVEHSSQLDEYKEKQKETNVEKYGVGCVLQNKKYFNKGKETMLEKYGVEYPIQNVDIKNQIEKTNLEKYGFKNSFKNRDKIKKSNLEKYGFENPTQNEKIKEKIRNTNIKNFIKKYKDFNIINYDMLKRELELKCDKNHIYKISYDTFKNRTKLNTILCSVCYPIGSYSNSGYEIQLQNFIKENYNKEIILNDRKITKKEIDIYLPDFKLAFEFNGLYWHNELNVSNNYHINKTEECKNLGIHLIHIYEDDWTYKQDIVKSRILHLLGKSEKMMARKCNIKEMSDNKLVRDFLEKNHLQGFVGSKIKIGLFYNEELVSLMTFGSKRKSMGQKSIDGSYEMLRFCNKLNTNVIGGASRLFKYFIKNYNPIEVTSYADRSWSNGNLYEKLGFTLIHKTQPNYYYVIKDKRFYRFGFRKDIIIKQGYDPNKTEKEIMLERKIFRIYDSGNLKYSFKV